MTKRVVGSSRRVDRSAARRNETQTRTPRAVFLVYFSPNPATPRRINLLSSTERHKNLIRREARMTSFLQPPSPNARSRKDSGSGPPTMVSLEEENNYSPTRLQTKVNGADARKYSDSSLPSVTAYASNVVTQKPAKASRRSSLGLALLGGKSDSNKSGKRRSSIAVVFLGRRNSKVCSERRRTGENRN
jgi:hypothetical protein